MKRRRKMTAGWAASVGQKIFGGSTYDPEEQYKERLDREASEILNKLKFYKPDTITKSEKFCIFMKRLSRVKNVNTTKWDETFKLPALDMNYGKITSKEIYIHIGLAEEFPTYLSQTNKETDHWALAYQEILSEKNEVFEVYISGFKLSRGTPSLTYTIYTFEKDKAEIKKEIVINTPEQINELEKNILEEISKRWKPKDDLKKYSY
jgi:hypothetical protein